MILTIPDNSIRILGIDPGSSHLGIAIVDYNFTEDMSYIVHSHTLTGSVLSTVDEHIDTPVQDAVIRIINIGKYYSDLLRATNPQVVVSEAPFMMYRPQAFKVLTEVCLQLDITLYNYDSTMYMHRVAPMTVKKFMGVPGKSVADKSVTRSLLSARKDISCVNNISISHMSEHEVDAVTVALWYIHTFYRGDT